MDNDTPCLNCGHALKFHLSFDGQTRMPCDAEIEANSEPDLCLCGHFAAEWKCMVCGAEGGQHGPGCILVEE